MYDERKTNTAVFAESLATRHPEVAAQMTVAFDEHSIKWRMVAKTENVWARDYMPLQVDDRFIKFRYNGELDSGNRGKRIPKSTYSFLPGVSRTNIFLDGGNCQRGRGFAILTDVVFRHNRNIPEVTLITRLEKLLEAGVVIIPTEPGDMLGHSDGIVKFIPGTKTVLFNDCPASGKKYEMKLLAALDHHWLDYQPFPFAYHKRPKRSPAITAFGYYINFLSVGNLVLLPVFGIEEDAAAIKVAQKHFPGFTIKTIDCAELSRLGGLINCVTANYAL